MKTNKLIAYKVIPAFAGAVIGFMAVNLVLSVSSNFPPFNVVTVIGGGLGSIIGWYWNDNSKQKRKTKRRSK